MDRNNARSFAQENRRTGGATLRVCKVSEYEGKLGSESRWQLHDLRVAPDNFFRPESWMRNQFHTLAGIGASLRIQFEPSIRIPNRSIQSEERVIFKRIHL